MTEDMAPDVARVLRLRDAALKVLDTGEPQGGFTLSEIAAVEGGAERVRLATDSAGTVLAVLDDALDDVRLFRRHAIRSFGTPAARPTCWVVAELPGGLRLYVSAAGIVISRADINP